MFSKLNINKFPNPPDIVSYLIHTLAPVRVANIKVPTHTQTHTDTNAYTYTHNAYTYTHAYTYSHKCIHVHTHTHTACVRMSGCVCLKNIISHAKCSNM